MFSVSVLHRLISQDSGLWSDLNKTSVRTKSSGFSSLTEDHRFCPLKWSRRKSTLSWIVDSLSTATRRSKLSCVPKHKTIKRVNWGVFSRSLDGTNLYK